MPQFASNVTLPTPTLIARHAARLDRCWPLVRVESVQIMAGAAGDCVHALVQLGGLVPADVRVEVMPVGAEGVAADSRGERRMFSSHALANGCFVFDVSLPHHDSAEPQEWLIHVHPSEALEEPRVEHRFSK